MNISVSEKEPKKQCIVVWSVSGKESKNKLVIGKEPRIISH